MLKDDILVHFKTQISMEERNRMFWVDEERQKILLTRAHHKEMEQYKSAMVDMIPEGYYDNLERRSIEDFVYWATETLSRMVQRRSVTTYRDLSLEQLDAKASNFFDTYNKGLRNSPKDWTSDDSRIFGHKMEIYPKLVLTQSGIKSSVLFLNDPRFNTIETFCNSAIWQLMSKKIVKRAEYSDVWGHIETEMLSLRDGLQKEFYHCMARSV